MDILTKAKELADQLYIKIQHVFREGNCLTDALVASAFEEEGRKQYTQLNQLPIVENTVG